MEPTEHPKTTKSEEKRETRLGRIESREIRRFYGVLGAVLLIWLGLGWGIPVLIMGKPWGSPGELGDAFGMVNALFSGLAFTGVIAAIWLQKMEFQGQLQEFEEQTRLQRAQLEQSTQAHDAQIRATAEQISLLQKERLDREMDRELSFAPLFTAEIVTMEEDRAEIEIFNGGGPIFRVELRGEQSHCSFSIPNASGTHSRKSRSVPALTRERPLKVVVTPIGFSHPKHGASFGISFVRGDHKEESYQFSWGAVVGLSNNPIPRVKVFKSD